ncbi:biotin-dependent carboxyltransferase family protein [Thalassobacillus sp. C254]|uniref:5-oxoprolinase subunit C family protein n=1 Tax=Thalassobacillus sp. C254 TaxID=1225341 RepID=UPI0006D0BA3B|nr:biotin-dependent carboxyltransferase family protein [Thalassobacillus sp. C254]
MSINILQPGLLTTVQDLGRHGYQRKGIIVSGGMDPYSLRLANMLVGNREDEAVLEMTLKGPVLEFQNDAVIAIVGGDFTPSIEGIPLPLGKPVLVKKNNVVKMGSCSEGCRAYVAFAGGINVPEVMNSKSTYLRAEIGGFHGRPLQAEDILKAGKTNEKNGRVFSYLSSGQSDRFNTTTWSINRKSFLPLKEKGPIRVIKGTHFHLFTNNAKRKFFQKEFKINPQSDRMGYRLRGPLLQKDENKDILSEAVALGTVQVASDGNPVILMADRQTTGGYPRIAQVIQTDIPRLAQLKPGDSLHFEEVTIQEAEELLFKKEQDMKEVQTGITIKFDHS